MQEKKQRHARTIHQREEASQVAILDSAKNETVNPEVNFILKGE